jgi:RNA polymerase sigma factor (sigma-70 family)
VDDQQAIENFLMTGAEESFGSLFDSVYSRVRRYFLLRGIETGEAEDLAQNVMVIIYRRANEIREPQLFFGWVFKVAKNELMRFLRRRQARHRIAEMEPLTDDLAGSLTTEMAWVGQSDFSEWLSYLEPPERELTILRYVEELSYEELAAALGLPLGTVKWKLFHIKKKLTPIINASQLNQRPRTIH